jgi:hypothetical protein
MKSLRMASPMSSLFAPRSQSVYTTTGGLRATSAWGSRSAEPLCLGQAGPHQVDGSAQLRVGFRRKAIGACEAPVELIH